MGCVPSNEPPPPTTINHNQTPTNNNIIFTIDERLKLKEVWVIIKQYGVKKLGDDIASRALERNPTLKTYWQNLANHDESNNLTFDENDTAVKDLIWKQTFKQHSYKILDKIDQLIMIMVTRRSTTDTDDTVLNDNFSSIGETHVQYKIKQDHIDIMSESFLECVKNVMYQNGSEWTIKHALTWEKFLTLITNQFSSASKNA